MPQQGNASDCGLYVLAAAEALCAWQCDIAGSVDGGGTGAPHEPACSPSWAVALSAEAAIAAFEGGKFREALTADAVAALRGRMLQLIRDIQQRAPS